MKSLKPQISYLSSSDVGRKTQSVIFFEYARLFPFAFSVFGVYFSDFVLDFWKRECF